MEKQFDFTVVGAGILGLATAYELLIQYPDASVLILEKESGPAQHQTGRNSGVIHAGVYYKPGSLKAKFCKDGNKATRAFCDIHSIPYQLCGKLIVATNKLERERMQGLVQRCEQNDIPFERVDKKQLSEIEPNIVGEEAILSPSTGIVSYRAICEKIAQLVDEKGASVEYGTPVVGLVEKKDFISVTTSQATYKTKFLVSCSGLQSDKVVAMLGKRPEFRIIPFRGEYFKLPKKHNDIVKHLIYPVPDPGLPFLGVHLTRMIDGCVTVGPNAVLALAREGYKKTDIDAAELIKMLTYPGLTRVLKNNFGVSVSEFKNSLSKRGYLRLVQKYCPSLVVSDLGIYPAGIRAQAVLADGTLVDDFLFEKTNRALVVCNAPSPAATSAFPIAKYITSELSELIEGVS